MPSKAVVNAQALAAAFVYHGAIMTEADRALLVACRQALLMLVDALERRLEMPRTADLRREQRERKAE